MRTASMLLTLSCTLLFTGCAANGPSKEVGSAGGTIAADQLAVMTVPAGTFSEPTKIGIERRSLRATDKNVGISGLLFDIERPAQSEIRVVADSSQQPAKPIELKIDVPRDLREAMKDDDREGPDAPVLRVFAKNVWLGPAGKLITLEPVADWSDPRAQTVTVSLPPYLFSRTKDDKSVATIRLALSRLPNAPVPAVPHPSDSPITSGAVTQAGLSTNELTLAPPLTGDHRMVAAFGPVASENGSQFHPGVDLAPDVSRDVHAMADGTVMAAGEQVDHDGTSIGFGGFVVLGHGPLGAAPYTVYAGLDPKSIHVDQQDTVRRGEVIGEVATAGDGRDGTLHVEYVPRATSASHGTKADPAARLGNVFIEHLVAGYRSTALLRVPAIDSNSDTIELVGNDADNQWWASRTDAKTSDQINGRTLAYASKTAGEVETVVDQSGLRVRFSTDGQPRVDAGKKDASNPSEASAAGTGGGRIRFMTTTPSHYKVHVTYSVEGTGNWSIEHRFQRVAERPVRAMDVNRDFATFAASGKEPAHFDKTFEGNLDAAGRFDFDFLPSIEIGGGSNRTAKLKASATLEVMAK